LGTFHRAFGGVHDNDLKDDVAFGERLLAGQSELAAAHQGILDRADGAADGGLAQAIGLSDVSIGAVLAPVHQRHQEPVFAAQLGRTAKGRQMFL